MKILQVIFIILVFFSIIMIFLQGTEAGFVSSEKSEGEYGQVTCYSCPEIQMVEQFKCGVLLQKLRIQIESECDCSEEVEEVENMYREYIVELEKTCYYNYNSYMSWEF
jgi:hypothetical protein